MNSEVKRGAEVARSLGWSVGERGVFGALGELVDPDLLRFHRPLSYRRVLQGQQQAYNKKLRHAVDLSACRALEEATRRSKVS
jgi:hypothetical protein